MPGRTITVDGVSWNVKPSGLITQYDRDEFALIFTRQGEENNKEVRVVRYSSVATRSRELSFAQLSEDELKSLLNQSQPSFTSPEAMYRA